MKSIARLAACSIATIILTASPASAATGKISTVAGTSLPGFAGDGGLAVSAELNLPRAISALPDGGMLIADRENDRVRRVWPNGVITTVAGSGPTGASNGAFAGDGGPATSARLDFLHDAAPTPDGGFLISDTRNERIRDVSPGGTIETVAGSGPYGSFADGSFSGDGGPADAARLDNPHGLAVNPDGSYLIADTDNNRVREVATDGTISTVAGSGPAGNGNGGFSGDGGPATSARLNRPFDVDPTAEGGFLIADTGNMVIRRVAPDGTIRTVAGIPGAQGFSGDGGPATAARLSGPHGVAATAAGGLLIADKNNQRIRMVAADGTITTVAGSGLTGDANGSFGGDGGPPNQAFLNRPKSVAPTPGGFLIADESNDRIRFVDLRAQPASAAPPVSEPPPVVRLRLRLTKRHLRMRRRGRLKVRFFSSEDARIRLEVRRRGRILAGRKRNAGLAVKTMVLGRRRTRKLTPGRYKVVLRASGVDGQRAAARTSLLVRRSR